MALLGMKKKQAFGQVPGMGMMQPDMPPQPDMQVGMGMDPIQAMTKKPSFFGEGGVGRGIAGTIGDVLMQYGGLQPTYGPQMQAQALARQKAMQAAADRETSYQDYIRKAEYDRANPAPKDPYRFEANNGDQYQMGPDGKPVRVFADPTPKTTYITADNGDGTKTIVPVVNGVPQVGGAARPQVGAVIADPRKGGQTVPPSATFPYG